MHSRRLITSSVVFIDGQNDLKTIQYRTQSLLFSYCACSTKKRRARGTLSMRNKSTQGSGYEIENDRVDMGA